MKLSSLPRFKETMAGPWWKMGILAIEELQFYWIVLRTSLTYCKGVCQGKEIEAAFLFHFPILNWIFRMDHKIPSRCPMNMTKKKHLKNLNSYILLTMPFQSCHLSESRLKRVTCRLQDGGQARAAAVRKKAGTLIDPHKAMNSQSVALLQSVHACNWDHYAPTRPTAYNWNPMAQVTLTPTRR